MNYKLLKLSLVFSALSTSLVGCGDNTTSAQHLASGLEYQQNGDESSAIIEYKNALKKDPKNVDARLALGIIYKDKGELAAAKKELSHAIKKDTTRRDAIIPYASVLTDMGDHQEVLDLPLLATSLSSENMIKAHYLRGKAYSRIEKPGLGHDEFTLCNKINPQNDYAQLCAATIAMLDEKLELASTLVQALVANNPDMSEALMLSGSIHSAAKQYTKAATVYQQYIDQHMKQTGLVNLLLAEALVNSGQAEEATVELEKILVINPLQPLANYLKARILFDEENFTLALLHASNAVKLMPNHYPANLIGGISAFRESDLEQSYRMLTRIESKITGMTLPVIMNVINNLRLGNITHARNLLNQAGQLDDKNTSLFMVAANEFRIAEDYESALAIFKKVKVLNPNSNGLKFSMGRVKLQTGDRSALTDLRETLFDPNYSNQSMLLLSAIYLKNGRKDKLTEMAEALKKRLPQSKDGWLVAGSIAVDNKEFELAKQEFSHILTLEEGSVVALSHLSKISAHEKDFKQALAYVDKALESEPSNVNLVMLKAKIVFSSTEDNSKAQQVVIDAYEKFNDVNHLIVERALIHAKYKEFKPALLLLAAISDKKNLSNKYWNSYSRILIADNRNGEALNIYQQWAEAKPNIPAPLFQQIALTERMRLFDQGLSIIVKGQENFGHIPEFHLLEVSFSVMAGKVKKARAKFNSLRIDEHSNNGYQLVHGELLVAEKKFQSAVDHLLSIYKETKTLRSLRPLSYAYVELKQQDILIPLLEEHLKERPNDTVLLPILAGAYTALGQDERALILYQDLVIKFPKHPAFLNNLAWLLYSKGDLDAALSHAETAIDVARDNAQVLDTHGVILLKLNQLDDAGDSLAKALLLQPKDFSINAHNAQLEIARGNKVKAKRLLGKVVARTEQEKSLLNEVTNLL